MENYKDGIVQARINQNTPNSIQKFKNYLKRHFAFQVSGHSMTTVLNDGDVAQAKKVWRLTKYNKGDIIIFELDGVEIVHEIIGFENENGEIKYRTKGVNNLEPDIQLVSRKDILGKVDTSTKNQEWLNELVSQGKLTVIEAYAFNEHQRKINSELKKIISSYVSYTQSEIIEEINELFSNSNDIMRFYTSVCGSPRTELSGFRNLLIAIFEIGSVSGLSNRKLTIIKNELIGCICSQMLKNGLTLKGLKQIQLPSNLYDLCKNIWDYYDYNIRESYFIQKLKNNERVYQGEWLGSVEEQRKIQWRLSDGRDFYTGQKFIDLYIKYNPDGLTQSQLAILTEEELEARAMQYTKRHHYRTDLPHLDRTMDSRISASVLIWKFFEEEIHKDINSDPSLITQKEQQYAKRFENTLNSLLKGKAPGYWCLQYRKAFNNQYDFGKTSIGIKYLFYSHLL